MIAPRKTPGARYEALLELLRATEALWEASRRFFVRWQLSPSQFNILNLLPPPPDGLSQADLSRQLIMHRSNVTGLVDRLEARGLVRRHDTPADRRAYRVVLTRAGEALLEEVLPHYYEAAEAVWGELPPTVAKRLARELGALAQNAPRAVAGEPIPRGLRRL